MCGILRVACVLAGLCLGVSSSVFAQSACLQDAQKSILDTAPWQLQGGASRDDGISYVSSVKPGEHVDVFVELNPLPMHVGKPAEVYLHVSSGLAADLASNSLSKPRQGFTMNAGNQLVPSNGIESWQVLAAEMPLQSHQRLKVFSGQLNDEHGFTLQMSYCLEGNLFYSRTPVRFVVDYGAPQVMKVDFPPVVNFAFSGATLNFRGGVESSVPYMHASVEIDVAGQPTRVAPVVPGGRWQFTDVPVAAAMTLSLKVNGQIVDQRKYSISREPGWGDIAGFALDAANRQAYVVDAGNRQLHVVHLDSGAKKLLLTLPVSNTAILPAGLPLDVVLAPDSGTLFVTEANSPVLAEFDMNGAAGVRQHLIDVQSSGIPVRISGSDFRTIEYSQNRSALYVADRVSGRIYTYDVLTGGSRLLAQLPGIQLSLSSSLPGRTLSVASVTDIALDEINDRLLAVSMFSKKLWAVNLTSGVVTEVFDQDKAAVTGVPPRNLPMPVPPAAPANALIADGFMALAHDSKRNLWLLGKRQELLGADLTANTVTQLLDPVASPDNFVAEISDLGYDNVRDRYVYVDGTFDTLYSYDPVNKQAQRLSGRAPVSTSSLRSSLQLLAPAQNNKLVYGGIWSTRFDVLDFGNESWTSRFLPAFLFRGVAVNAPIGVDNVVRDFVPAGANLAYDATRNRHVLLSSSGLPGQGMQGPPGNAPMLGIRGVPAGTGTVFIPAPVPLASSPRIFSVDFVKDAFLTANPPLEELVPVYAGNSADLQNLLHVAVKADGSQYMFANALGELFAMNSATRAMTKLPSPPLPVLPMALAYVGGALLQLDMLGQLHAVNTDPRSARFGERSLLSGTSKGSGPLFQLPAGMVGAVTDASVYVSSQQQQAIGVLEISSGNRSVVSGPQRGEGDPLRTPGAVTRLQDARTLYVSDEPGLVAVDVETGDRITLE